jgi:hypothetical protein
MEITLPALNARQRNASTMRHLFMITACDAFCMYLNRKLRKIIGQLRSYGIENLFPICVSVTALENWCRGCDEITDKKMMNCFISWKDTL